MAITDERLFDSLKHNRKLLKVIYESGMSQYYDTDIIHDALRSIVAELRRRGF
ncbi:hypothetical protein HmCmsJML046_02284 [Escherichia coli]|nr:hypothetical protein HmCmsJML046_02284 [Escherichia coli]